MEDSQRLLHRSDSIGIVNCVAILILMEDSQRPLELEKSIAEDFAVAILILMEDSQRHDSGFTLNQRINSRNPYFNGR